MKPRQMSVRLAAVSRIGALGLVAELLLAACGGSTAAAGPQAWGAARYASFDYFELTQ